ncbi:MAG: phosphatase PAP2-related protein [Chitinophagaceae bacterium]
MDSFWKRVGTSWKADFSNRRFKVVFFVGLVLLIGSLALLPFFYPHIEGRDGYRLNDWVLNWLPPADMSVPIFSIVWGAGILGVYRALLRPVILMRFFYAYIIFVITRSTCLVFVPLDPPLGIVELRDPLTNIFYGGAFMTHDLFYSGHTAAVVIICLLLEKKIDKLVLSVAACILAVLLLVQHVHYTIDVLAAVVFAFICCKAGNFIVKKSLSFAAN